jgi:hypothetical protein
MAQQVVVALPRPIVAVPKYVPSNAVVVDAGACAAAGVATAQAVIVISVLVQPNMLLSTGSRPIIARSRRLWPVTSVICVDSRKSHNSAFWKALTKLR